MSAREHALHSPSLVWMRTLPRRIGRNQQRHCAGALYVEDGWEPWVLGMVSVVHWGIRPGVRQVFKTVLKEEGMAGFYKGCAITCARYDTASGAVVPVFFSYSTASCVLLWLVPNSLLCSCAPSLLCFLTPVLPPSCTPSLLCSLPPVLPPSCAPSWLDACLRCCALPLWLTPCSGPCFSFGPRLRRAIPSHALIFYFYEVASQFLAGF